MARHAAPDTDGALSWLSSAQRKALVALVSTFVGTLGLLALATDWSTVTSWDVLWKTASSVLLSAVVRTLVYRTTNHDDDGSAQG